MVFAACPRRTAREPHTSWIHGSPWFYLRRLARFVTGIQSTRLSASADSPPSVGDYGCRSGESNTGKPGDAPARNRGPERVTRSRTYFLGPDRALTPLPDPALEPWASTPRPVSFRTTMTRSRKPKVGEAVGSYLWSTLAPGSEGFYEIFSSHSQAADKRSQPRQFHVAGSGSRTGRPKSALLRRTSRVRG